ncbi:AraC-like DNA-binding protein [Arcicella aurantiaca]|uniref:AraC-like DNA-binding protein n=1 Tax=Arcicella aurantiaca TaxID=591202 RepID=A0A316E373_9BACT|nr:helix-turn-helix transcriptional regulator [Arcicella aurantiaca]PWK23819.1 AraC-like DNA-binding protein [Arcicella aurantiaca]
MKKEEILSIEVQELIKTELKAIEGSSLLKITSFAHNYFHINRLEDFFKLIESPLPTDFLPRRMNVYYFIFLTKGNTTRSIGLETYEFGENTFFFVPAHEITTHKFVRNDVQGYYCHFDIQLLAKHTIPKKIYSDFPFLEYNSFPLLEINPEAKSHIVSLLERLLFEYQKGVNGRIEIFETYLLSLFTELQPFVKRLSHNSINAALEITKEFKKALSKNITHKNKVSDYAELLNISPNHLNKCVKSATGKSANDLVNEMLLLEAKVMLKQTNLSIKEIAYNVGKSEVSVFSRFFKTQTGISPTDYRLLQ